MTRNIEKKIIRFYRKLLLQSRLKKLEKSETKYKMNLSKKTNQFSVEPKKKFQKKILKFNKMEKIYKNNSFQVNDSQKRRNSAELTSCKKILKNFHVVSEAWPHFFQKIIQTNRLLLKCF